jgi:hypothetical protein
MTGGGASAAGGELKRTVVGLMLSAAFFAAVLTGSASAAGGVEHLHFEAGPYTITPGANLILVDRHATFPGSPSRRPPRT